ncbi:MAG: hypothetical protein ACFFAS_04350 [Promethearchaeota archaeon]
MAIENKKKTYSNLFKLVSDGTIKAMLNLWAVASIIENKLPITQEVLAVRGFINDPYVIKEWIEMWIEVVWKRKAARADFLEFIAMDLRRIPFLKEQLKKMLYNEIE